MSLIQFLFKQKHFPTFRFDVIQLLLFIYRLELTFLFILCSPVQIRNLILNPQVHLINQILVISLIGALYEEKVSQEPSLLIIKALSFHLEKSLELELWLGCQPSMMIPFLNARRNGKLRMKKRERMIPSIWNSMSRKMFAPRNIIKIQRNRNHKFWLIKH